MVLPPPMQSSLPAGWLAFTGRASNPLDHNKRFQITHPPFLRRMFDLCGGCWHSIVVEGVRKRRPGAATAPLRAGLLGEDGESRGPSNRFRPRRAVDRLRRPLRSLHPINVARSTPNVRARSTTDSPVFMRCSASRRALTGAVPCARTITESAACL
jgi:hypothetical protein